MGWNPWKTFTKGVGNIISGVASFVGKPIKAVAHSIHKGFDDLTGRTKDREDAEHAQAVSVHNKDTILGQMERDLTIKKQEATEYTDALRKESDQIQGVVEQSYGQNQQKAYLETIAAEAQFQDMQAGTSRSQGALKAGQATSGLRNSGSISDVSSTETASATAAEGRARRALNAGISSMVSSNQMGRQSGMDKLGAVRAQAGLTMGKFNEGSSYMDLYNWNRSRTTEESDMQVSYLDSAIDRTFSASGYFGDALKFTAGAVAGFGTGGFSAAALGGAALGGVSSIFA